MLVTWRRNPQTVFLRDKKGVLLVLGVEGWGEFMVFCGEASGGGSGMLNG